MWVSSLVFLELLAKFSKRQRQQCESQAHSGIRKVYPGIECGSAESRARCLVELPQDSVRTHAVSWMHFLPVRFLVSSQS